MRSESANSSNQLNKTTYIMSVTILIYIVSIIPISNSKIYRKGKKNALHSINQNTGR